MNGLSEWQTLEMVGWHQLKVVSHFLAQPTILSLIFEFWLSAELQYYCTIDGQTDGKFTITSNHSPFNGLMVAMAQNGDSDL